MHWASRQVPGGHRRLGRSREKGGYNTVSTRKKGWHIADKSVREYRIDLNGKLFARIRQ
jgi:hypothetical protein